ncbi:hypothetical protein PHISCL_01790 [Aspergillus sclerotialis]|uniref:Zn(2)-C6 fungal-type domain-containing protein n=1 Tax=Aspergillus sclerotialis TaxID=2070753 RepID=A0A3A2ZU84_9EURO|nr:hypothetical protein PHISCL_01790 [Aspergillus sclerotialis]
MPRPKVDERFRKRIAKACQYCRLTKQKCDGLIPCKNCQRRDRSDSCAYSPEQPNRRHRSRRKRMQIPTGLSQETIGSEVSDAVTNSSQKNEETRSSQSYQGNTFSNGQEVSVPGLSHVLYDNQGKVGGYSPVPQTIRYDADSQ